MEIEAIARYHAYPKVVLKFLRYPGVNETETFGILLNDYSTVRHDWKLQQLQNIMPPLFKIE